MQTVDNSGFFFQPGKEDRTVVLLPGFATDYRIFEGLAPDANRICPLNVDPHRFAEQLFGYLQGTGVGRVTLFGWSLGAFLATDFAVRYSESVDRLVLVGARKHYDRDGLDQFGRSMREDRKQCLLEFYTRCFLPTQRAAYRRFRETLLSPYLQEMEAGRLLRDLEYLYTAEIRPNRLPPCPVTFVHGAHDVIAPVAEARELAAGIPGASLHMLPNAAHAAFLDEELISLNREILR
ncbi:MAG: alpha/beta hydrolase [Candidatus Deferrimicrobiaceae bacterium]